MAAGIMLGSTVGRCRTACPRKVGLTCQEARDQPNDVRLNAYPNGKPMVLSSLKVCVR